MSRDQTSAQESMITEGGEDLILLGKHHDARFGHVVDHDKPNKTAKKLMDLPGTVYHVLPHGSKLGTQIVGWQPESWLRIRKFEAQGPQIISIYRNISTIEGRGSLRFLEHSYLCIIHICAI